MAIFKIGLDKLERVSETNFAVEGIMERNDLQRLLKSQIEIISPNTLVIAEEFGEFEGARRRIDLLGIDKDANLVVIELKRTEDGGHMELQAIRYAAMVSTMTFKRAAEIYKKYLEKNEEEMNAEESLLNFLDWEEANDDEFCQDVKIVLASAEFSKELTASVLWLNDRDLDINCFRMKPYKLNDDVLLDVQKIIPLPETADFQVQLREKKQKERESRSNARDFTKFDLEVNGEKFQALSKRWMMFYVISGVLNNGGKPQDILDAISWRKNRLFEVLEGALTEEQTYEKIMEEDVGGAVPRSKRFFLNEGETFHFDNKTYVLTNQWGNRTTEAVDNLSKSFPKLNIKYEALENNK
tara:strand:- start:5743 stop:6807 length:1065 start_codon:yes stop_codon:yes gene_type:complete